MVLEKGAGMRCRFTEEALRRFRERLSHMKRLYRSRTSRILGGVCGGLSAYSDIDPNLIRILWVALTLISIGIGVLVYIVA
jgi:phage shock protein C